MAIVIPNFLFRFIGKKTSKISRVLTFPGSKGAVWSSDDYKTIAEESYLKNAIAFACIFEIAKCVSSVPWKLYRRISDGKREPEESHYVNDLIKHPNPDDSFNYLMFKNTAFLTMNGNSYMERVGPTSGINRNKYQELFVHRPDRMKIHVNNGDLDHYEYGVEGRTVTWKVNPVTHYCDILHFKLFHPLHDWYGSSVTKNIAREIDSSNEATEWNMKMLQKEGRPGMVVTLIGQLSEEQYNDFKKMLDEQYSGAAGAGRNMLLVGDKGTEAKPYGWSPHEFDNLQGGRELARRIAIGYGMPPMLLGIPGDNTYSLKFSTRVFIEDSNNIVKKSKPICEIEPGDRVYSLDGSGKLITKEVLWGGQTGVKKVYRIKTRNRTIEATDVHPFLVRRKYCESGKLDYRLEYVLVKDLHIGDILVILKNLPDMNGDMSPVGKVTEEHMELYGYFIGNGYLVDPVSVKDDRGYRRGGAVCLAITDHVGCFDYYVNLASKLLNANPYKNYRAIRFPASEKVREFRRMGFNGGAKTKRVPDWIFGLKRELKIAFLRGLLDSDGSLDHRTGIRYFFNNEELIKDVRDLCISCGFRVTNCIFSNRMTTLPNGEETENPMWTISLTKYKDCIEIGTHTPKYQERINDMKSSDFNQIDEFLYYDGKNEEVKEKIRNIIPIEYCEYSRILSIEELDEKPVYDIEVEGNHNFFAEGICVHNSNQVEARMAFWETTIFFYLQYSRNELNNWFFPNGSKDEDLFLDYILDDVPALAPKRDAVWQKCQKSDFLTVNEKREMIGLPSLGEKGDVILVSSAMIRLADVGMNFEQVDRDDEDEDEKAIKRLMEIGNTRKEAEKLLGFPGGGNGGK